MEDPDQATLLPPTRHRHHPRRSSCSKPPRPTATHDEKGLSVTDSCWCTCCSPARRLSVTSACARAGSLRMSYSRRRLGDDQLAVCSDSGEVDHGSECTLAARRSTPRRMGGDVVGGGGARGRREQSVRTTRPGGEGDRGSAPRCPPFQRPRLAKQVRHSPGVTASTGPFSSFESLTSTRSRRAATSTHSPLPVDRLDFRHFITNPS